jgi:hypothetical protein
MDLGLAFGVSVKVSTICRLCHRLPHGYHHERHTRDDYRMILTATADSVVCSAGHRMLAEQWLGFPQPAARATRYYFLKSLACWFYEAFESYCYPEPLQTVRGLNVALERSCHLDSDVFRQDSLLLNVSCIPWDAANIIPFAKSIGVYTCDAATGEAQ